jgi:hypothetical protein
MGSKSPMVPAGDPAGSPMVPMVPMVSMVSMVSAEGSAGSPMVPVVGPARSPMVPARCSACSPMVPAVGSAVASPLAPSHRRRSVDSPTGPVGRSWKDSRRGLADWRAGCRRSADMQQSGSVPRRFPERRGQTTSTLATAARNRGRPGTGSRVAKNRGRRCRRAMRSRLPAARPGPRSPRSSARSQGQSKRPLGMRSSL